MFCFLFLLHKACRTPAGIDTFSSFFFAKICRPSLVVHADDRRLYTCNLFVVPPQPTETLTNQLTRFVSR